MMKISRLVSWGWCHMSPLGTNLPFRGYAANGCYPSNSGHCAAPQGLASPASQQGNLGHPFAPQYPELLLFCTERDTSFLARVDTASARKWKTFRKIGEYQMIDPNGDWAEATGKTADAAKALINATSNGLSFVSEPLRELIGMATDTLAVKRFERKVRLVQRAQRFLSDNGVQMPTKAIPLSFSVPLIEHASVEENDDLQDIWARMLANAADAGSQVEMRTAFVNMLSGMTAFDVTILALIHKIEPTTTSGSVYTGNFPDSDSQKDDGNRPGFTREDVAVSLGNLARLGCISPGVGFGGPLIFSHINLSPLGKAFIRSCTERNT
jgi:hypothetical protein